MVALPVVETESKGHLAHHNALHATHNALEALGVGEVLVGAGAGIFTAVDVDSLVASLPAGVKTATFVGDGVATSFPIPHNLNTLFVKVVLFETVTGRYIPEAEYTVTANGLNESTANIHSWGQTATPSLLPDTMSVTAFVSKAGDGAALDRLPLYALTGHTATLPYAADSTYADLAAFEAAVVPTEEFQACRLAGWPTLDTDLIGLEARLIPGTTNYEWGTL